MNALDEPDHDSAASLKGSLHSLELSTEKLQDDAVTPKTERILAACRSGDVTELAELATSRHGLVNDEIRRTACVYGQNLLSQGTGHTDK